MELIINNEIRKFPEITFNYDQIVSELTPKLEKYKNMVYTDETIALAKKDKAMLNNLAKAVNTKKIEIKNRCLEPYVKFEVQIKNIIGMIEEASGIIDKQVKAYDDELRNKKLDYINKYFNETAAALQGILQFEKILNPKWLNVTFKMNSIKAEIDDIVKRTEADLALIDGLKSEFETELKTVYLSSLDISAVLLKKNELDTAKEKWSSVNPRGDVLNRETIIPMDKESPYKETETNQNEAEESTELITLSFKVIDVTPKQLAGLKEYMQINRIKYDRAE